jgi:hypothetical protein
LKVFSEARGRRLVAPPLVFGLAHLPARVAQHRRGTALRPLGAGPHVAERVGGRRTIRVAEPALDVRRNLAVIDYTMLIQRNGRDLQQWHETHRMRYLFEPEVSELLKRTGFELCDAHESVTGRALGADTWSATFVAKKRC